MACPVVRNKYSFFNVISINIQTVNSIKMCNQQEIWVVTIYCKVYVLKYVTIAFVVY
jgi:hypothetical protein